MRLTSWKIQLALGIAILALLAVGAVSYQVRVLSNESVRWVQHTHEVLENLQDLRLATETIESSYRGFALTGNESDLEPYHANVLMAKRHIAAIRNLTLDNPTQQRQIAEIEKLSGPEIQLGESVIALRETKGSNAAADLVQSRQSLQIVDEFGAKVRDAEVEERRLLELRDADAARRVEQTKISLLAETFLGLLIVNVAGWTVQRYSYSMRRAQAAEQLLNSEATAALLDLTHDAIFVRNLKGEIVFWNKAAEGLYGWGKEEVLGRTSHELLQTIFPAPLVDIEAEILRNSHWEGELIHRRRDGSSLTVSSRWSVQIDGSGKTVGTLESNRDLSQRQQQEKRFRDLMEAAPDAMVVVNQSGEIVLLNVRAEKQFGYQRDELLGQKVKNILPEGFEERLIADVTRTSTEALTQQIGISLQVSGRRKDGNEFPIEMMLSPLETTDGILVTAAIRDITERKRAEEHLIKTADELRRSNDQLERFAYIASHDLQEPLRMVASYTQLLARRYKGQLDSDANEYIDYAVDGCVRMKGMIQGLLTYSRCAADNNVLREISGESALKEALANLRTAIEESSAIVTHDSLPAIYSGDTQLALVFQNLVGNAIKYRGVHAPRVHISAVKNGGNEWLFSVRDNGLGIEPRYFEKIFVLFQRLHGRNEFEGTGIGLAICKTIVERLGGKIWVESRPENGSIFYFSLPGSGVR
jgi:PAS domain S-box-containing protein